MFNVGDNDKEKLKENMKEIKKLIQEGDNETQTQEPVEEFGNPPLQQENKRNELEEDLEQSLNEINEENPPQESTNSLSISQSKEQQPQTEVASQTPTQEPKNSLRTENNPLFLRVNKFEEMKRTVEEMRHLTQEVRKEAQKMEETAQKDRNTDDQTQHLLNEFKSQRDQMQNIILDQEK